MHADGIQAGTILPSTAVTNTSSSTVLLRLDNGQRMIEVDEYDTEPVSAHYLLECDNGDFICFSLRRDTSFNAGGSLVFLPFFWKAVFVLFILVRLTQVCTQILILEIFL